jgi:hypothetical protein
MERRKGTTLGVLLVLTVTGCSASGSTPGIATVRHQPGATSSAAVTANRSPLRYAQCMRANGIDVPDPVVKDGGTSFNMPDGVPKAKVDAANKACAQYNPAEAAPPKQDPKVLAAVRKMAQCMRDHGIAKFPDPGPDGGLTISGGPGLDLDPTSPAYKAAEKTCSKYLPDGGRGAQTDNHTETGQ